jgi:hypothetical protein
VAEAKVHWSASDDVLPECNPRGADLREVTTDAAKVTCKTCIKIMVRRYGRDYAPRTQPAG